MAEPTHTPKIVEKPWGREIWYADQAAYAGKVLLTLRPIAPGETPSATLATSAAQSLWLPGQSVHIPARTIHRFEALEDSVLLEVSTPDLTDIVRLQDDFARPARD